MPEQELQMAPNEVVAERIISKLLNEGLIQQVRSNDIRAKLVAGTAKSQDWHVWTLAPKRSEMTETSDDE